MVSPQGGSSSPVTRGVMYGREIRRARTVGGVSSAIAVGRTFRSLS